MSADRYVRIIMRDETEKIVRETPVAYEAARIEREYEFEDGAVVRYEWRDISLGGFNHRFSLVQSPKPNPDKLSPGVIHTIDY
ncbi:MAG: hypothetical protein AB7F88_05585 [Pyrinomonadaceae bacterium]